MTANDPKNMNELIDQIKQNTKNKSQSISDQLRVQQMLLNDPDYEISIYDKNKGRIGSRNVHTEAVNFISDIISGISILLISSVTKVSVAFASHSAILSSVIPSSVIGCKGELIASIISCVLNFAILIFLL